MGSKRFCAWFIVVCLMSCKVTSKPIPKVTTTLDGSRNVGNLFWRQVSGQSVTINGVTSMRPIVTFTKRGIYEFELRGFINGTPGYDTVKITVK